MKLLHTTVLALILASPAISLGQHAPPSGSHPAPPVGGPSKSPLRNGKGGERHGGPGGRPNHPPPPHLKELIDACDKDFTTLCADKKDLGACFHSNASCFSTECVKAVEHAVEVESHHDGRRPGSPHGEHHGHHKNIPQEVKDACKADKEKLCGDKHGRDVHLCMKEHSADLSDVCSNALKAWIATMPTHHSTGTTSTTPTPSADHGTDSTSAPSPTPSTVASPTVTIENNVPVASLLEVVDPTPSVASSTSTTAKPSCGPTPTVAIAEGSHGLQASEVVNYAYTGTGGMQDAPAPNTLMHVIVGSGAAIFVVAAIVIAVRRYKARRTAAFAPVTSQVAENAASTAAPVVTGNPLAYSTLNEEA